MDEPTALAAIYDAIDLVNDLRRADDQLAKTPGEGLAGEGGRLDSLALATLVLAIERRIEDDCGREISLLDEAADGGFARFATPATLAQLIVEKLA